MKTLTITMGYKVIFTENILLKKYTFNPLIYEDLWKSFNTLSYRLAFSGRGF